MQRDCYRCGHPLEERLAFCPACGAPQIRVSTAPQQPSPPPDGLGSNLTSSPSAPLPPALGLAGMAGIEWSYFLRTAAPLAAFTGLLTVPLPPLGFFVLLPASLIWTISRYRQHRLAPLRRGQGARMGALMGLLSFGFFLVFFLTGVFLNQTRYREMITSVIQDRVAQAPDLQTQQMLQWFATPDGMITFTAILLAFILGFFLIIGMGSGALAVALGKARNRPELWRLAHCAAFGYHAVSMNPASSRLPNLHVKGRLMSGSEIERTLVRLAHQIVEKNNGVENLVLVGIKRRGVPLANRLAALIQQIEKKPVPVGTLDITLYRDDLSTVGASPVIKKATPLGTDIVDKNVILLDDVLYTGRTVRAAMDALFDHGRPRRVQLCVLIDRGHRELPIEAAFVGRTVQTTDNEIIEVKLSEIDQEEQVLMVERIS